MRQVPALSSATILRAIMESNRPSLISTRLLQLVLRIMVRAWFWHHHIVIVVMARTAKAKAMLVRTVMQCLIST